MYLIGIYFPDSKVNDFHSEAESNDGRSSGKNQNRIVNRSQSEHFSFDAIFFLLLVKTDKSFFSISESVILSVLMTVIYLSLPCPKAPSY